MGKSRGFSDDFFRKFLDLIHRLEPLSWKLGGLRSSPSRFATAVVRLSDFAGPSARIGLVSEKMAPNLSYVNEKIKKK